MPHLDGFAFLKEVRAQDHLVKIPFIFLTAKGDKRDRFEGAMLGASHYLTKPFDAEDLLTAVQASVTLDRRRKIVINDRLRKELDAFKRKILTILNHEFRTPLTLVVAYADMLKDYNIQKMSDEEVLEFLRGVNSGADRLHRLIENFILLVEIERGDAEKASKARRREIYYLKEIVHRAWSQISLPGLRPRDYVLNVPDDLPVFVMDDHFLTIMIREMLDNAAKFSKDNARIVLNARRRGQCIEISVQDYGRGIIEEEQEKIWQPFYQIDREQFEDQGAGSGLAIIDGIVKMYGGTRSVVSEKGKGSVFTIALPLQPKDA
jgi:K+-sensing histidine kinase KdpD